MHVSLEALINSDEHKEGFKQLFALMRSSAFTKLTYNFDGSGDSGTLEKACEDYEGLHSETVKPKDVTCSLILKEPGGQTMEKNPKTGGFEWVQLWNESKAENLEELGYGLAEIVLNNDPHDWYNNDGGFGTIVFEITEDDKNSVFCDMNVRIVTEESHPDEVVFDG